MEMMRMQKFFELEIASCLHMKDDIRCRLQHRSRCCDPTTPCALRRQHRAYGIRVNRCGCSLFTYLHQCPSLQATSTKELKTCAARALASQESADVVHWVACSSTFSAAVARSSFSVLVVSIQKAYGMSLNDIGLLQSGLLVGYVLGQIPAGLLADRYGGPLALTSGMILWSLASWTTMFVPEHGVSPLVLMVALRFAVGLAQSVMMPGVSSISGRFFCEEDRATRTSSIYAFYSIGTVFGTFAAPYFAAWTGNLNAIGFFGLIGLVVGLLSFAVLLHKNILLLADPLRIDNKFDGTSKAAALRQDAKIFVKRFKDSMAEILLLSFVHSVIGFAFFIFQSWIPTFLHGLGVDNLRLLGILSALPWAATAIVALVAGKLSDYLQNIEGWPSLRCRRLMQSIAMFGAAAAMVPQALQRLPPLAAAVLLTFAMATQGFNYAGYHSYVADVAPRDSGVILGITNTLSILSGIVGVVLTGRLAGTVHGFSAVFAIAALCFVASGMCWFNWARGQRIDLSSVQTVNEY